MQLNGLSAFAGLIPLVVLATPQTAQALTCSDFSSQQAAQTYYEQNNANHLDRDRDGIACEALPSRPVTNPGHDAVLIGQEPGSRINVREGAGTDYRARHDGLVGDSVYVLDFTSADDGYIYMVSSPVSVFRCGWLD